MIRFYSQYDESSGSVTIDLPSDSSLSDTLEAFERFLKATGYSFDGVVDIVEETH